jgi:predicted nuclease with TOPRIM domain
VVFSKREPESGGNAAVGSVGTHPSVVELFQSRNLLKRELDTVTAERDVLRTDVEDLRKRYEETQRQLSSLEQVLSDPERGQSAILYYRLRAIWDTCRQQLKAMAEDMSGRQEQLESGKHTETAEQRRAAKLQEMQRLVDMVERNRQLLEGSIAEMEGQIIKLKRFWHRKKREQLQQQIDSTREKLAPLAKRKAELMASLEVARKEPITAFSGISIPARRAINLAVLAMAQYLYLHFTENNIAEMARSSGLKPVSDVNYGMPNDCLAIGAQLRDVVLKLRADTARPEKLKLRVEYLRQKVTYAGAEDTVPEESSLDYMLPSAANSPAIDTRANAMPVNVMSLNYWDIQNLLLKPPEKPEAAQPDIKVVGTGD